MFSLVYLTQEQNTVLVELQTAIAKIRVSAPERANPIAVFLYLATVLVRHYFGGGALVGVESS